MKKYSIKCPNRPELIIHAPDEKLASFFYLMIAFPVARNLSYEDLDIYEELGHRNSDIAIKEL